MEFRYVQYEKRNILSMEMKLKLKPPRREGNFNLAPAVGWCYTDNFKALRMKLTNEMTDTIENRPKKREELALRLRLRCVRERKFIFRELRPVASSGRQLSPVVALRIVDCRA